MQLSREQVRHVATLARLALEPGEEDFYATQLSGILAHIGRLGELDTDAIPPTALIIRASNVMRDDEPRPCLGSKRALANAPAQQEGMIVVRTILEGPAEDVTPEGRRGTEGDEVGS